jgi:phage/plasmid-associated DNA primase
MSLNDLTARLNAHMRSTYDMLFMQHKKVTKYVVNGVKAAMEGACLVREDIDVPVCLDGDAKLGDGDFIAMANGLLDVEGALRQDEDVLREPTPSWFDFTYRTYEYDPTAKCPKWLRFLKEVLPEKKARMLLQEFIGLCLVFDASYHKFLLLVGEGANGKAALTHVLIQLLGPDNVSHVPLEQFGEVFAMAPTIGKLANIVSDIGWRRPPGLTYNGWSLPGVEPVPIWD